MTDRGATRQTERDMFAVWLATPTRDRNFDGRHLPTEQDFASHYKIDRSTLYRWKQDRSFMNKVDKIRLSLMESQVAEIIDTLKIEAQGGGRSAVQAAKLYLELAQKYNPRQTIDINTLDGSGGSGSFDSIEYIQFFAEDLLAHESFEGKGIDLESLIQALVDVSGFDETNQS